MFIQCENACLKRSDFSGILRALRQSVASVRLFQWHGATIRYDVSWQKSLFCYLKFDLNSYKYHNAKSTHLQEWN